MKMILDERTLKRFQREMDEREYSPDTKRKYTHTLEMLLGYAGGRVKGKGTLIAFKSHLKGQGLAPSTINGAIVAVNTFLDFCGNSEWRLRTLKIQRRNFRDSSQELTEEEFRMLVKTARDSGDERMVMMLETSGGTGIRVSEYALITVEGVEAGKSVIVCKGKTREVLIPDVLCKKLREYCSKRNITSGPVFVTRSGKPLNRSNIWKMYKQLAEKAGVDPAKVFPHNFRHLFAATYYKENRDIVRLADILGHSSIETTRIYTMHSSEEQRRQMDRLGLVTVS